MTGKREMHVLEHWDSLGGFHREYRATCRCGWQFVHYNAGYVRAEHAEHKAEREALGETWEADR